MSKGHVTTIEMTHGSHLTWHLHAKLLTTEYFLDLN